jgi:hypothetical protein
MVPALFFIEGKHQSKNVRAKGSCFAHRRGTGNCVVCLGSVLHAVRRTPEH